MLQVKTGIDRFTADAALELFEDNVSMVSLWPGLVKTEGCSFPVLYFQIPRDLYIIKNEFYI